MRMNGDLTTKNEKKLNFAFIIFSQFFCAKRIYRHFETFFQRMKALNFVI